MNLHPAYGEQIHKKNNYKTFFLLVCDSHPDAYKHINHGRKKLTSWLQTVGHNWVTFTSHKETWHLANLLEYPKGVSIDRETSDQVLH